MRECWSGSAFARTLGELCRALWPYAPYTSHHRPPVTNGAGSGHREEEEEEEEDDEEVVEEELEHHDTDQPHQSASSHSSPRANAAQSQSSSAGATSATASADYRQAAPPQDHAQPAASEDGTEKRRPGRPRGSRNRKPRVSAGSATKAPANTQHPGFYQYPPAPGTNQQNQQFYEFQWRALNLCSEFYNAAEELVKAASPMVIAQCYKMGPGQHLDPLVMIAEAKRVCDNLLANPSQLVNQPIPASTYQPYSPMPPPPPPGAAAAAGPAPTAGSVITNPQTFVMPLNSTSMPPPAQPYYPPMYTAAPGARYPTAPYYYPPPQGATPYYPSHAAQPAPAAAPAPAQPSQPAQPAPPAPTPTPAPAPTPTPASAPAPAPAPAPQPAPQSSPPTVSPPVPSNTGTISTFNAATGNTAPGGHQGAWSEEETERLKRLADQSREMGGPQNKGEIEWDWVIQQWGNSRTRHQILLKATSLGLKESTTRGTKRRRADDSHGAEHHPPPPPPPQPQPQSQPQHQPQQQAAATSVVSPTRSPMTSTPTSIDASPAMQPAQRPPSSTSTLGTPRTANMPAPPITAGQISWPPPTTASPSSILQSASTTDTRTTNYYRAPQTTSYGAAAAAASTTQQRPPSSHRTTTQHQYMYQPNGAGARRDSSSLSHAGATTNANDGQAASDPNHSPTMMMSQPPNHPAGPVQVQTDPNAYGAVHRAHYATPDGYTHHVLPYGMPAPPPPGPHPGMQGHHTNVVYQVDPQQAGPVPSQSQQTAEPQEEEEEGSPGPSPSILTGNSSASVNGKRKHPDSATPDASGKKRRQRAAGGSASASAAGAGGEDGEEAQDLEVGPNGGAKHWTEEEKTRFFTWMLTSDEHWDAFRTRMNTVFRECSNELFPGRKSYTALKSCYHRNLEVFKQVHAFQVFSANHFRQLQAENPNAEQPPVEAMLEAARVAGLNVGNLNVKVIDRWYETGWFDLFKKRYREDPKTGLPTAYYGPADQPPDPGPSSAPHAMMGLHSTIDPQLMSGLTAPSAPDGQYHPTSDSSHQSYPYSPSQASDYRQAGPSSPHPASQSFQYLRSTAALPHRDASSHATHAVTESLLGVCSSLKELLQQQVEESRARTELMRAEATGQGALERKDREKEISIEKVTFATEILKSGPQNEEIKKAAIECLTKYLMRDL
ncbi:hypothetical protein C8T65DRAFT_718005 [Cerioporus squamosus]|nr:hypothetical protein C8T65DRAFT_718005 [Cerioporus squamosus]